MKRTWQCPKCAGTKVGYFDELLDEARGQREIRRLDVANEGGVFSPRWIQASVEAFVCTECGYFEEYVKDAANVPWDKLPHFRWCRR
jgi:hypothetical protein